AALAAAIADAVATRAVGADPALAAVGLIALTRIAVGQLGGARAGHRIAVVTGRTRSVRLALTKTHRAITRALLAVLRATRRTRASAIAVTRQRAHSGAARGVGALGLRGVESAGAGSVATTVGAAAGWALILALSVWVAACVHLAAHPVSPGALVGRAARFAGARASAVATHAIDATVAGAVAVLLAHSARRQIAAVTSAA